jgi:ubiquitin carboxyl-terminal hydrolase 30
LKSEILLGYVPHGSSVSRVTGFASRVYKKEMGFGLELNQWKKNIYGPFDGTLQSTLTCSSCSSVVIAYAFYSISEEIVARLLF